MKRTSISARFLRRAAVITAAVTTIAATAMAAPAAAAPDTTDATAQGTCPFINTLCLFDEYDFGGARFNVKALDPTVGACVNLVEHGWGGGRVKSGINTNPRSATLFPNDDCTGRGWPIDYDPAFTVFEANSVFVW